MTGVPVVETAANVGDPLQDLVDVRFANARDAAVLESIVNQQGIRQQAEHAKRVSQQQVDQQRQGDRAALQRQAEGDASQDGSAFRDVRLTELTTRQLIRVLRENPALRPSEATAGGKIVKAIVEDSNISIDQHSAPYLFSILQKALSGAGIRNPLDVLTRTELEYLREAHPTVADRVVDTLAEAAVGVADAADIGQFRTRHMPIAQSQEAATHNAHIARSSATTEEQKKARTKARQDEVNLDLRLPPRYYQRADQINVLWGITSPENFVNFLSGELEDPKNVAEKERLDKEDPTGRLWAEHFSDSIETKIVGVFDEFFVPLDESNPKEFFESIAREDYIEGFGVLLTRVQNMFRTLPNYMNQSKDPDVVRFRNIDQFKFYIHELKHVDEEHQYESKDKSQILSHVVQRYANHAGKKEVGLEDFVRNLGVLINSEREVREFTHNVKALFYHPVDSKTGFYGRMAEFTAKLLTGDIDEFLRLPDNPMFMTAYTLYCKFLEADFAKYDWRHPPGMFELVNNFNTSMELEVLEYMKLLYKDVPLWRIKRALSLGVGAALGIFQTEPETAAYADTNLRYDGTDTYADYYRNGTAPLKPLAPWQHHAWRFQREYVTMADLVFLPIKGISKLGRYWDHTILFKEMNKFKHAFMDRSYDPLDDGVLRLMEIINFAQVGGIMTRSTWRMEEGVLQHLSVFKPQKETGEVGSVLDYLETWKSYENVGFEILFNYQRQLNKIFTDPSKNIGEREALFRYLYKQYIMPGASEADFKGYMARLDDAASKGRYMEENKDLGKPRNANEVYRFETNRALATILKRRIPTKFLRLERGRFVRGGKNARLWDSIRHEMGITDGDAGVAEFDGIVKDLAMVETLHRNEVSTDMEHWLEGGKDRKLNDVDLHHSGEYNLTAKKVKDLLGTLGGFSDGRINRAVDLLNRLHTKEDRAYLDHFATKLQFKYVGTGTHRNAWTELPFAVAPEELDSRFMNWRGAGPGVVKRHTEQTGKVETEVVGLITEFPKLLSQVANDGKKDFGAIVEALEKLKYTMTGINGGVAYPTEMVGHLAAATIAYFKKDTMARNTFTRLFTTGSPSSMAAEFAGVGRNVWEWEVADIHKFINALEARHVVSKAPTELSTIEEIDRKYFGIKFGKKIVRKAPMGYSGAQLRKDFGATGKHIFLEIINKYVPLIMAIILFAAIADGVEDAIEDLKGSK